MPISLLCPRCDHRITDDAVPGNTFTCPTCGGRVDVPELDETDEPDLPEADEWDDPPPRAERSIVLPLAIGGGRAIALLALAWR